MSTPPTYTLKGYGMLLYLSRAAVADYVLGYVCVSDCV